jgi:hypothetical protein
MACATSHQSTDQNGFDGFPFSLSAIAFAGMIMPTTMAAIHSSHDQ